MAAATFWLTGLSSATRTRRVPAGGAAGTAGGATGSAAGTSPTARAAVSASSSSDRRTGLVRYATTLSLVPARADEAEVSMMTRRRCKAGSAAISRQRSRPSMPGMWRSSTATSGTVPDSTVRRSSSSAEPASGAESGVIPNAASWRSRMARLVSLSSTIRAEVPRSDARSTAAGSWSGRDSRRAVNQNVLPCPTTLSTPMEPPIIPTRRLEMASPRPVPP